MPLPFTPFTKEELHDAVYSYVNGDRINGYIHRWDVSHITDMSNLFSDIPTFNEPITNWDVSNVTSMANMFYGCTYFNQDLSGWDVSRVTDMSRMFYKCSNFTGLSHKKEWSCISSWNTQNVYNMTSMLEDAVLFSAKISGWNVYNVVYCENFSKNCCHMRHVLPKFSKHSLSLSLIVPLPETSLFDDFEIESPIITSAKQLSPLSSTSVTPLQDTPPYKLLSAASPLITAIEKMSPVKSPEVEYIGTKRPSPVPYPEVEYIGTKRPSPVPSPDVEYIGTKRPSPVPSPVWTMSNFNFFTEPSPVTSGGYKRKKTKNKSKNKSKNKTKNKSKNKTKNKSKNKSKNKMNKTKIKKNINDILATDLAY
jgi:surface protein